MWWLIDIMSHPDIAELWVVKGLEVAAEVPVRCGENCRRGAVELPQLAARRQRSCGTTFAKKQNIGTRRTISRISPHTFTGGHTLARFDAQLVERERKAAHALHVDSHALRRLVPRTRLVRVRARVRVFGFGFGLGLGLGLG